MTPKAMGHYNNSNAVVHERTRAHSAAAQGRRVGGVQSCACAHGRDSRFTNILQLYLKVLGRA